MHANNIASFDLHLFALQYERMGFEGTNYKRLFTICTTEAEVVKFQSSKSINT